MSFLKTKAPLSARKAFYVLSAIMFFFCAQVALTIYVDSSYLGYTIAHTPSMSEMSIWQDPEHAVGTLYTFASLITLLALILAPRFMRRHGNYRWTLSVLIVHVLLLLGLSMFQTAWLIIPLFIIETALVTTLYFNLDVFLERYSTDEKTGVVRGLFMVIGSIAWLIPPLFAGKIIDAFGFQQVYLLGALIVLPTIFIMMRWLSDFKDLAYDDSPIFLPRTTAQAYPDIRNILITTIFLQFFYAWMVIYTPLYFHNHLGVSYAEFGIIITIALTSFVIFPYPAGILADKFIGEKELIIGGFLLMASTSLLIPVLSSTHVSIFVWAGLLFIGRMGASVVETMCETYFFKKIDGHNAGLIGYFRRARPIAYIVAPIIASVLLEFGIIDMKQLFYVLAGIMILAIYFPLRLVDTK